MNSNTPKGNREAQFPGKVLKLVLFNEQYKYRNQC